MYNVGKVRENGLSSSPVSDYIFKDSVATYRIVGGWEVHTTTLRSSAGSSGWNGTNPFTTSLKYIL